jgi:trans-aconitate methyltransferase
MSQTWSPSDYLQNAAFVPALGAHILARLAPGPGERILDLGCGDGTLTAQIVSAGATVVGVDASPAMVAAAVARGLDARLMDAQALTFDGEFDGVFSNAVLHWVGDASAAIDGVRRALKPGGRFVAEFGGHGNVAAIDVAIRAVLTARAVPYVWPWYYPTPDEYAAKLQVAGLAVEDMALVPRPTPLPTGMAGWLRTFGVSVLSQASPAHRESLIEEIVELLRPSLCDHAGRWTADYVRLQVVATKT